ncbi:MAG: hypothetical protein NDJ90_04010 [Oligoflexia bacterium]|nr:hypothetical protein [Oligoflexia bacterium]
MKKLTMIVMAVFALSSAAAFAAPGDRVVKKEGSAATGETCNDPNDPKCPCEAVSSKSESGASATISGDAKKEESSAGKGN